MLPKKFRLPAKDFKRQYQRGKKIRGRYGMFVVSDNDVGNPRFGFVVSKKVGNAVERNRVTRVLRAIVMDVINEKNMSNIGKDFQYIAFKACEKTSVLRKEVFFQMQEVLND